MEAISTTHAGGGGDAGWTWPPYVADEPPGQARFRVEEWAPASTVRHPWVRVGRFTLLYRRAGQPEGPARTPWGARLE